MLDQFVNNIIQAYKEGVSITSLRLSLTDDGMSDDEIDDLLDIVILESREKPKCD
jgi:hypothetical protein